MKIAFSEYTLYVSAINIDMNKKMISLRLPKPMLADMAVCCSVYQINRTTLIERAVREFMINWWQREGAAIRDLEDFRAQKKRQLENQDDASWF